MKSSALKAILVLTLICIFTAIKLFAQDDNSMKILGPSGRVSPFDRVTVVFNGEGRISVTDGAGNEYFSTNAQNRVEIVAGGAAGTHTVTLTGKNGKSIGTASFELQPQTSIDDGGMYRDLFRILYNGMTEPGDKGIEQVKWNGNTYKFFVSWDLDNSNTMNGMQYFSPWGYGLTDLLRETQREDGMIWSFVREGESGYEYYETAYGPINFFMKSGDGWFVRQPVDNHSDYCYVNMFYKHWKASGNNDWMKLTLPSAARALDYCFTDSIRWSKRFGLLKRPYCIDSWDFQVDDEYTPRMPVSPTMVVVPGKTKYGIFFGDNTGYFEACNQLAEMYDFCGEKERTEVYRDRAKLILDNLVKLSWNGKYFTHFIDEDSTVHRHLGVDERSQIAQANMYSLNRGLPSELNQAIIKTYIDLKDSLPKGSPGEWYSIYPPFEKGFGQHNQKWQYMNGGVAGHAIGELARGAYENGFEDYATGIMERMYALAVKYGNKLWFSYTGAIPDAPPSALYSTVDISAIANMDLRGTGGKGVFPWMNDTREGNDMRNLPTGSQTLGGIPFKITDPAENGGRSAIAISSAGVFPGEAEVKVSSNAGSVCLLHSVSGMGQNRVAVGITFVYSDGTSVSRYLYNERDVTNWWFPSLKTDRSAVAWSGPNPVSTMVGVCRTVIDNPEPSKKIEKIRISASLEGGIYALLALTLADKPFYKEPDGVSYGGPDNWAAGNGMCALIESLAGVKNTGLAFSTAALSPRWTSAGRDTAAVTVVIPASGAYLAYTYLDDTNTGEIRMLVTGSSKLVNTHIMLPKGLKNIVSLSVAGKSLPFTVSDSREYSYADFILPLNGISEISLKYR
jgi:hypothetical protein